ncbi:MAG: S8 family serine peptidase [Phycisphaerae bacterium]|mgnify:CR=1 FL=1|nr:S8 family serine peptidase [Phycisphaerae bacterium]
MMFRLLPASFLIATLAGSILAEQPGAAGATQSKAAARQATLTNGTSALAGGAASSAQFPSRLETKVGLIGGSSVDLDPAQRTARPRYPKKASPELKLPMNRATNEVSATGRIILKMNDELGARAPRQGPIDRVVSIGGHDLSSFDAVLARYGGTVQQWITNKTDVELRTIELRAEANSKRGQPDLASYMVVNVPANVLVEAGRALNDLAMVEFVEFERPLENVQNQSCDPMNASICNAPGAFCPPELVNCNPDPGGDFPASGCADVICCTLIGGIIPYCDDPDMPQGWDVLCAAYANLLCEQTIYDFSGALPPDQRYDPCFTDGTGAPNPVFVGIASGISGGCFEAHDGRGCNIAGCCFAICSLDPTCCTIGWDASCVNLTQTAAFEAACTSTPDPGPTPDFKSSVVENPNAPGIGEPPVIATNWQTYLVQAPAAGDFSVPVDPAVVFTQSGWRGGGYDLDGVRALQQQFATLYQGGITPNFDGKGVRVGIIEFSAFTNHEDFTTDDRGMPLVQTNVILEPGQTPILITGGANAPEHGTATLGICVAVDNGFGVTGIAHKSQGYFFPTLSVEEGSRLPNAIASAAATFEPGDVLNFSIGFPGAGPIIVSDAIAGLIASCTDIGITCCMSAGNDGIPIDPAPFETGAIVVGACSPGGNVAVAGCDAYGIYHYCRLGFSNFTDPDNADGLATVHLAGWGTSVCTTGYGNLFRGENGTNPLDPQTNHLRTYTNTFNGTSSAAPTIAGLAAVMQGWAKQLYGSPISPVQLRGVLSGNGIGDQCWPIDPVFKTPGPDSPNCNQDIFKDIGTFPDALECAFAVMNGQFVAGNATEIKVLWGNVVGTQTFSTFPIRALDGNYLKIATKYAPAGNTVEQLSYMAGGPTTDVIAFLETGASAGEVTGVALSVQGKATVPTVLLGGFLWNNVDSRWDFIGVGFLAPGGGGGTFGINPFLTPNYIGPGGVVQARVWTCGLGLVPPHQVWHDLIQITVVGPTLPAP